MPCYLENDIALDVGFQRIDRLKLLQQVAVADTMGDP
jgi:hypothetical protein